MDCPNCQVDVKVSEQNFGSLYTCPACQAAYFISFEGKPEFGQMEEFGQLEQPRVIDELNLSDFDQNPPNLFAELNQNEFVIPETFPSAFDEVAKDISDFGNSETQVASLNYDLRVSGLDTSEILKIFKEAIDDRRFGWETNEMMRSIKNGEIFLAKLNPVKAYILSKRLQFLDVQKMWKQNVLS
jgi:hypothetical protein